MGKDPTGFTYAYGPAGRDIPNGGDSMQGSTGTVFR
jgi:hypothetical protein